MIVNTAKDVVTPILHNLFAKCAEKNPNTNIPTSFSEKELAQTVGGLLEQVDKSFTANPELVAKLQKDNPADDNSQINFSQELITEDEALAFKDKYNTDQDIVNKVDEIEQKHNIGFGEFMSYLPLVLDNTFSPYDSMEEEDKTNAGYEGKSILAKFFTWLRDMWHSIFPAHTWLGKFGSFVFGGLAKLTDIVWSGLKQLFCSNDPDIPSIPEPEKANITPWLIGGAAVVTAGFFLVKPMKNPLPDKSLNGHQLEILTGETNKLKTKNNIIQHEI
jgi:hypothetical protein